MKIATLQLLLLFFFLSSYSQTAIFKGTVRDAHTKEFIPGASISDARNTNLAAVSDSAGNFSLALPAGKHLMACSFIGMKSVSAEFDFKEGETVVYNFNLQPAS